MTEKYEGVDNYGKPKSQYLEELRAMIPEQLFARCKDMIWLSAYAANNSHSDFHWQCDACHDECKSRDKIDIYQKAFVHNFPQEETDEE